MSIFTYGLRARPPSIGAVPRGFDTWTEKENVSEQIKENWDKSHYRHGILTYSKALTPSEVSSYELVDMNQCPKDKLWEKFVEFCGELVEYEVSYNDFVADYVHPHGTARESNPLHRMKPIEMFDLLKSNGFGGKLKGLETFYNQV